MHAVYKTTNVKISSACHIQRRALPKKEMSQSSISGVRSQSDYGSDSEYEGDDWSGDSRRFGCAAPSVRSRSDCSSYSERVDADGSGDGLGSPAASGHATVGPIRWQPEAPPVSVAKERPVGDPYMSWCDDCQRTFKVNPRKCAPQDQGWVS